jgi:hypothetical protein
VEVVVLLDEEDVVDNPLPVVENLEIKQRLRNLLVIEEEIDCCLLQLLLLMISSE